MLILRLPLWLAQKILSSDFADEPDGYALHQALLTPLRTGQNSLGGDMLVVEAPVASWDALSVWLLGHVWLPRGASQPDKLFAAKILRHRDRIAREIDKLAAHPAYRGVAVVGRDTTVLPAFGLVGDSRYWPTFRQAAKRSLAVNSTEMRSGELRPSTQKRGQRYFTHWTMTHHSTSD